MENEFEKWWLKEPMDTYDGPNAGHVEAAWKACKNKCLEILKKSQTSKQDGGVFDIDVIKEIEEKL